MTSKGPLEKLREELTDIPYEKIEQVSDEKEVIKCNNESNSFVFDEIEVRKILESEVYFLKIGKNIQNKIQIIEIFHSNVYLYGLQTWSQKRQLYWQFKKYKSGRIDDTSFGNIPEAWDIPIKDEYKIKPFSDHVENIMVKHSEYIQPCFSCSNLTMAYCEVCGGNKSLVYYLNCKVTWHSYKDKFVSEPHYIPFNKLELAPGEVVYEHQDKKINPVIYEENEKVTKESEKYHKQHRKSSKKEKVLLQKQFIKKYDVFTVHYTYKNKFKKIFIYGNNREVHVPYTFSSSSTVSSLLACIFM